MSGVSDASFFSSSMGLCLLDKDTVSPLPCFSSFLTNLHQKPYKLYLQSPVISSSHYGNLIACRKSISAKTIVIDSSASFLLVCIHSSVLPSANANFDFNVGIEGVKKYSPPLLRTHCAGNLSSFVGSSLLVPDRVRDAGSAACPMRGSKPGC